MVILGLGIVAFLLLVTIGWWISTYNGFKATFEAIKTQWSNIVTEYERRVDLFLNLAKTVKSLKKHEKETLTEVTRMRSGLPKDSKVQQLQNMKKIDSMITGFFEAYPQLVSAKAHEDMMEEIRITEDRINFARTGYNGVVREYNTSIVTFPSNVVAKHYKFGRESYYETDRQDVTGKAPEVAL